MKLKNIILHFNTITKHRWVVFKLSLKAGIPWRGLVHDLSKYSPTEFWEGVKYYQGYRSPILACVEEKGYSEAQNLILKCKNGKEAKKISKRYYKYRDLSFYDKYCLMMTCMEQKYCQKSILLIC